MHPLSSRRRHPIRRSCDPLWRIGRRKGLLASSAFPCGKGGIASAALGCSRIMAHLRRSSSLFFILLSPSNLRPFGAPPSYGRRECPREPLPLEGAAERSEAGLASFLGGEAASSLPSSLGEGFASSVLFSGRDDATGKAILIHSYYFTSACSRTSSTFLTQTKWS